MSSGPAASSYGAFNSWDSFVVGILLAMRSSKPEPDRMSAAKKAGSDYGMIPTSEPSDYRLARSSFKVDQDPSSPNIYKGWAVADVLQPFSLEKIPRHIAVIIQCMPSAFKCICRIIHMLSLAVE